MVGGGPLWDFYRLSYRSVAPSLIAQLIPPYKTTEPVLKVNRSQLGAFECHYLSPRWGFQRLVRVAHPTELCEKKPSFEEKTRFRDT
jgi:hypothetical protein